MTSAESWKVVIGPTQFPNIIDHLFLWIFIPLHFIPYPVRALQFIIKYHIGKAYADKEEVEDNQTDGTYSKHWINVSKHKFFLTDYAFLFYSLLLLMGPFILGMYRLIKYQENQPGHYGNGIQKSTYIFSAILVAFISIFLWVCVYFLRNVHDEIAINTELKLIGIAWIIAVPCYVAFGIANIEKPDVIPPESPPICCIILCMVSFMISFSLPVSLATWKNPDFKLTIPEFRSVDNVLEDPNAYKMLRKFMQSNTCVEGLLFLRDTMKYKSETDPDKLHDMAHRIYEKYIFEEAPMEINIGALIRTECLKHINEISPNVFDRAIQEIKKLINQDQLPRFMQSSEMMQYIKNYKVSVIPESMV